MIITLILTISGFLISLYAFYIEKKMTKNPEYKPVCDLSDKVSCSKPIKSPYGKFFPVPNSIIGMIFYALMFLIALFGCQTLVFYGAVAACLVSIFLAYILLVKIKSYCLICFSMYVVNILLLISSYFGK
jgi:vitamin-K-epoxide reductase (warfarin-sensitive)